MSLLDDINDVLERSDSIIISEYINGTGNRRSGRTTRLVWYYINKYFDMKENEKILIEDHYNTVRSNRALLEQIMTRLSFLYVKRDINYNIKIHYNNIYIKKSKIHDSEHKLSHMNNIIAKSLDEFFNKGIIRVDDFKEELDNWNEISHEKIIDLIQYSLLQEMMVPYKYLKRNYKNKTIQNLIFK